MDSRDKAIEELKKQISRARMQLGPEGVERLQHMMKEAMPPAADSPSKKIPKESVPYNREAALQALSLFIKNHKNRDMLEKQLMRLMKEQD